MSQEEKLSYYLQKTDALDRVTDLIHTRLVDCGWRDRVRLACRKAIADSPDRNLSVDDLIQCVTASARGMIPDLVKKELLIELENIIINMDMASVEEDK